MDLLQTAVPSHLVHTARQQFTKSPPTIYTEHYNQTRLSNFTLFISKIKNTFLLISFIIKMLHSQCYLKSDFFYTFSFLSH